MGDGSWKTYPLGCPVMHLGSTRTTPLIVIGALGGQWGQVPTIGSAEIGQIPENGTLIPNGLRPVSSREVGVLQQNRQSTIEVLWIGAAGPTGWFVPGNG